MHPWRTLRRRSGPANAWRLSLAAVLAAAALPQAASGGIVLRAATSADNGAGATTLVIAKPAGVLQGDLLLAQVTVKPSANVSVSGWTLIRNTGNGATVRQRVYRRTAGASEPASYTFTLTGTPRATGGIVAYSGVELSSPVPASSQNTGSSAAPTASGVDPGVDDALLVALFGIATGTSFTTPAGMSELWDVLSSDGALPAAKVSAAGDDELLGATAPTGSRATSTGAAGAWVAHLVALRPDTTAPTTTATAPQEVAGGGNQFWEAAAKTQWFRPTASGSFRLRATATDTSGVRKASFPDISSVTGWTGSTGGDDTSSPYASPATYAWTSGASDPGSAAIIGEDYAGLTSSDSATIAADGTAPTGQSVDLAGGPWYTALAVPLTISDGNDADSGLNAGSRTVQRSSALLSGGACGGFGGWSTVTLSGSDDTGVASGFCYRYRLRISDNVANVSAWSPVSAEAKVDTSGPGAPVVTLSESSPYAHLSGGTMWVNPAESGSFEVAATAADAESGIAKVAFPGGVDDTIAPFEVVYATADLAGTQTLTAHAGNGLTADATFDVAPDTTAPSGGSVSYADGWDDDGSVEITAADGTDGESGLAGPGGLERSTAALSEGTCGAFGAWAPVTSPDTVASGLCARYRHVNLDNVGNAGEFTSASVAMVDGDGPVALMDDPGSPLAGTVTLSSTAEDPESGVASVVYEVSPAGAGTWAPVDASWDTTAAADGLYDLRVVVTNTLGDVAASAPVTDRLIDNTAPGGSGGDPGDYLSGTVTLTASPTDDGAGVASVEFAWRPTGSGPWTPIPPADVDGGDGWSVDWDTTSVADGEVDLQAVVEDGAENETELSLGTKTVDNTAPTATIEFGPDDPSATGAAAFGLSADEDVSTFECSLDGGGFSGCADPETYSGLAVGAHTFEVRAVDLAGNTGSVVSWAWTVVPPPPASRSSDRRAPSVPGGFHAEIVDGELVLLWQAATDGEGPIAAYYLYDRGRLVDDISGDQLHAKIGPFGPDDPRVFSIAAVDKSGNVGARTHGLRAVPAVVGLDVDAARAALAASGFTADAIVNEPSRSVQAGLVLRTDPGPVAPESSTLVLVVSSGLAGAVERKLTVRVSVVRGWRASATARSLRVRVLVSQAARVRLVLVGPGGGRVVAHTYSLRPGRTIVTLRVIGASPPGRYELRATATTRSQHAFARLPLAPRG